jgi:hypothetical protein
MRLALSLAAAGALALTQHQAKAACHFSAERVVGCFPDDADIAAQAYQRFRNNPSALSDPSVKEVLASAGCRVIASSPQTPFHIFRRAHGQVATLHGYEPVSVVEFKSGDGGHMFSVDSRWISGTCDLPPPPTVCVFGDPCNPAN